MLNHFKFIFYVGVFTLLQLLCIDTTLAQNNKFLSLISTRSSSTQKNHNKHTKNNSDPKLHNYIDPQSAYNLRTFIVNINWKQIPEWQSLDQLINAFNIVHNQRQYNDTEIPSFLRRITWLYSEDGCFQRAANIAIQLNQLRMPKIKQLYIFNHITNNWVYHVAPAARVGEQVYILDPALNPLGPIKLWDWLELFTDSSANILSNLCDETTWDPNGNCYLYSFDYNDIDENKSLQQWREEFQVLERAKLGTLADDQLGDNPPWIFTMKPVF